MAFSLNDLFPDYAPRPMDVPQVQMPQAPAPQHGMGKGQMIAGILADMMAGAMGKPGQFGQMMQQRRQQEQEEVQWGRRREAELEDYRAKQQIEREYRVNPLAQSVADYDSLSDPQKATYKTLHPGQSDIVTTTLPGGRIYSGPRDGLAAALGGMSGQAPGGIPAAPVGGLTPLTGGGAASPSPRGFRY